MRTLCNRQAAGQLTAFVTSATPVLYHQQGRSDAACALQQHAAWAAHLRASGRLWGRRGNVNWLVCPHAAAELLRLHDGRGSTPAHTSTAAETTIEPSVGTQTPVHTPALHKPAREQRCLLLCHALTAVSGAEWARQRPAFEAAAGGGPAAQARRHAEAVRQAGHVAVQHVQRAAGGSVNDVVELALRAAARGIVGAVLGPAEQPPSVGWQQVEDLVVMYLRASRRRRPSKDQGMVSVLDKSLMGAMQEQADALLAQWGMQDGGSSANAVAGQASVERLQGQGQEQTGRGQEQTGRGQEQQQQQNGRLQPPELQHQQQQGQQDQWSGQQQQQHQQQHQQQAEPNALLGRLLHRPELSRQEAICNSNSCLIAGTETTASVIACSLLHLAAAPGLQATIRVALQAGPGKAGTAAASPKVPQPQGPAPGPTPSLVPNPACSTTAADAATGAVAGASGADTDAAAAAEIVKSSGSNGVAGGSQGGMNGGLSVGHRNAGGGVGVGGAAAGIGGATVAAGGAGVSQSAGAAATSSGGAMGAVGGAGRSAAALLSAVMKETLRVHPPVMGQPRLVMPARGLMLIVPGAENGAAAAGGEGPGVKEAGGAAAASYLHLPVGFQFAIDLLSAAHGAPQQHGAELSNGGNAAGPVHTGAAPSSNTAAEAVPSGALAHSATSADRPPPLAQQGVGASSDPGLWDRLRSTFGCMSSDRQSHTGKLAPAAFTGQHPAAARSSSSAAQAHPAPLSSDVPDQALSGHQGQGAGSLPPSWTWDPLRPSATSTSGSAEPLASAAPFGIGPRSCPAGSLSLVIAKQVLQELLLRYEFSLSCPSLDANWMQRTFAVPTLVIKGRPVAVTFKEVQG